MPNRAFFGLDLSNRLDAGSNSFLSTDRTTVVSGRKMLIEGCRGLLEYTECRIKAAVNGGKLTVSGTGMRISAMNGRELLISGKITCVEWE